jgi:hypothetical protein
MPLKRLLSWKIKNLHQQKMQKSFHDPRRNKYVLPLVLAGAIMIVALIVYFTTRFSSIQESINELNELPNIKEAHYEGDGNKLVVTCTNNKKLQIILEDTLSRYSPVISDFCR